MQANLNLERDKLIWLMLRQTGSIVYSLVEDELRLSGKVSYERATVLYLVKILGRDAIPAEIARWIVREPHTISALIERMEKDGLIKKVKDLPKKNVIRIELTEKGNEALDQVDDIATIGKIMSCLTDEEQRNLLTYLSKLRENALDEYQSKRRTSLPYGFQLSSLPQAN